MKPVKYLYLIILVVVFGTAYSQTPAFQKIKFSRTDSLRMINLPELEMTFDYFKNKTPLPLQVDNSEQPYFRGLFWQHGCSCAQASSEGYVFTYEINRIRDLDASLDENRYPYTFTYNFLNNGSEDCGANFLESQDIIREAGIPNVPTNDGNMFDTQLKKWLSGYEKYYSSMQNRIDNVYKIQVGTPQGLETLKHWLHNHLENSSIGGLAFFFAEQPSYETIPPGTPEGGKHIATYFNNTSHAMTIVGYNDEVRYDYNSDGQFTNDIDITGDGVVDMKDWEIGAFKIANTTTPTWADSGFCYVMYRVLPHHTSEGGIWDKSVYVTSVKENYTPLLTAKINMTYNSRDKIRIIAGVSTDLSSIFPEHIEEFPHFKFQGNSLPMQGGNSQEEKTIEIGLDISELLNYVDSGQTAKFFLLIKEDDYYNIGTGTINNFSIIDYTNGVNEFTSNQVNIPIVDNGNTLLSVENTINYSQVKILTDTIPKAELSHMYNTQLISAGGTEPYSWHPFYDYKITSIPHTLAPISGQIITEAYNNIQLDFDFPFYDKKYQIGSVNKYGALMFEYEDVDIPYDKDYSILFRYFKSIAPFHGNSSSASIEYEGDASSAKVYWSVTFDETVLEYMITLFPDGTIYIDYGDNSTIDDPEWSSGITKGDQISYQKFNFSGQQLPSNTRIILEPRPFPDGLNMDDNGQLSGIINEHHNADSIFVKVIDNNWIESVKGFPFEDNGLLVPNYHISSSNNFLEYGETAHISLEVSNNGVIPINELNIRLHKNSSNYTLIDSLENVALIPLNESLILPNAFELKVDNDIPDNTILSFVVNSTVNECTKSDTIAFTAKAPRIKLINSTFLDGGNNIFEPNETGNLLLTYKNTGGAKVTNMIVTYSNLDTNITVNSVTNNSISELLPDSICTVNLTLSSHPNISLGQSWIKSEINADKTFYSSHEIYFPIGEAIENWETGTIDHFPWETNGNTNWFIDPNEVFDGNFSIRSGEINNNESSTLSITGYVGISGSISFYRKSSSRYGDGLYFYIDDVLLDSWTGSSNWINETYPIPKGIHTFKWTYMKDGGLSLYDDAAWIDNINFPAIDFNYPLMLASTNSIEKWITPNKTETDTIYVANNGGGLLSYSAITSNEMITTWLTLENDIGYIYSDHSSELFLNYNTQNLDTGTYTSEIIIQSSTENVHIPLTLHVQGYTQIDEKFKNIKVYPNPAKQFITIETLPNKNAIIEIYNTLGIPQYKSKTNGSKTHINTSNWPKGLYILAIQSNLKRYKTSIIIE